MVVIIDVTDDGGLVSPQEDAAVLFEDLRLCAVKPMENTDRRFCFELLSVQK